MSEPILLERPIVEALHAMQIERFGGADGLRDENALESALARPINNAACGCEHLLVLAAAYLLGLARNHAFVDGDKRIAIVASAVFLMENGLEIETTDAILYECVLAIAAGEIDEDGAAAFLKDVTVPLTR